jgi:flagellin-specific chaperone FliS
MKLNNLINELKDRLKLESAQTTNEYTVALYAISSTSVFLANGGSAHIANAVASVARLLP